MLISGDRSLNNEKRTERKSKQGLIGRKPTESRSKVQMMAVFYFNFFTFTSFFIGRTLFYFNEFTNKQDELETRRESRKVFLP